LTETSPLVRFDKKAKIFAEMLGEMDKIASLDPVHCRYGEAGQ